MSLLSRHILTRHGPMSRYHTSRYDVFINHRGVDTKRTISSLLYDHLARLNARPFLDYRSMKPGDKLFETLNNSILGCKVGIAVFSPRYCESYHCLSELALIMETKKKLVQIFWDIQPNELRLLDGQGFSGGEIERFTWAIEQAKRTVGLTFDPVQGNWSDLVTTTADIVMNSLEEITGEECLLHRATTLTPNSEVLIGC